MVELLGEGGMGAVYVAEHLKLHKHVALKTIRAQFAANSQAEARFTREALATARLDHPHVVSAIDYGHLPEGGAYLVIQLVRGHSLTKRIEQGPLTWQQACKLGAQIADALAAAHGLGIIHRDLKPDNILLEPREGDEFHARVLDFGIARVSGGEGTGTIADISLPITRMGAVVGTPGYMAPEQAVGEKVDVRADLYALGVILWEACTGRYLWDAESLTDLFAAQLSKPAPHLHGATRLEVPPPLANLVAQLLARKPEERPATAVAVRDELRKLALSAEVSLILAAAGPATPPAPAATLNKASASAAAAPAAPAASAPAASASAPAASASAPSASITAPSASAPAASASASAPAAFISQAASATPTPPAASVPRSAARPGSPARPGAAAAPGSVARPGPAPERTPSVAEVVAAVPFARLSVVMPGSASAPASGRTEASPATPSPSAAAGSAAHPTLRPAADTSAPSTAPPAASISGPALTAASSRADARPEPTGSATAIPRVVWLGGLVGLVLVVITIVVAVALSGRKDSSASEPAASSASAAAKDDGASDVPRPRHTGHSAIAELVAEVPELYAEHARTLLTSDDARARERAGTAIALAPPEDKPGIPEYLRNLAWFEQVTECEDKRPILDKIWESGDTRALPGLQRIAATPPGDCRVGFMRFECIECLRDELARVIARFEAQR
ncbi:protein kinase domain-containing protein [Nannocystis pusilla]|uniref:serine/threonine-protein kinase n=1 Tax=Nannocystis pusilla TaxID=889268 RepID=UPI003BF37AC9